MKDPITASTASRITRFAESTIRLWAAQGILPSLRLPSGIRVYERADVERIARERERQHDDDAA